MIEPVSPEQVTTACKSQETLFIEAIQLIQAARGKIREATQIISNEETQPIIRFIERMTYAPLGQIAGRIEGYLKRVENNP
jgi:hypothetical protein